MSELRTCISKDETMSIRKQCELLDLAPSSYYHKGKGESQENLQIMRLMDEEFLEHPTHGVFQMQDFLRASGLSWPLKTEHFFDFFLFLCRTNWSDGDLLYRRIYERGISERFAPLFI